MKPIYTTLLMGLIAAVCSIAAAAYFPWPEPESATSETGEKLFEEFGKQVWSVKITNFDRDLERLSSINLRRKGQKWVDVTKSDFVITGERISAATACLDEKTILVEESEDELDHAKFGVIDPTNYQTAKNRDALGSKITLEDVNRNVLGSLIVGARVKDTRNQYYVRKPGQPKVYAIEFDYALLTTNFADWVNPNFLNLVTENNRKGNGLSSLVIENYRLDPAKIGEAYTSRFYKISMGPSGQLPLELKALEIPDGDGWKAGFPNAVQRQEASIVASGIANFRVEDVIKQESQLVDMILDGVDKLTPGKFALANQFGFRLTVDGGAPKFEGTNGHLVATTSDGVQTTVLIGNIAGTSEGSTGQLNYYIMLVAQPDPSLLEKPQRPEPAEGESLSEDEEKKYARAVKDWESKLKSARSRSKEVNQLHSGWYYIVNDEFINRIRPTISGL